MNEDGLKPWEILSFGPSVADGYASSVEIRYLGPKNKCLTTLVPEAKLLQLRIGELLPEDCRPTTAAT